MFRASAAPAPCSSSLGGKLCQLVPLAWLWPRTLATFEPPVPSSLRASWLHLTLLSTPSFPKLPSPSGFAHVPATSSLSAACPLSDSLWSQAPRKCVCSSSPVLSLPYTHPDNVICHPFTDEAQMCTDLPSCFT